MIAIMAAFTLGVGRALTGTWKSLLIDDRNKASLARFQLAIWTGIVLSAYATAIAWNRTAGSPSPLEVPMPEELWILLGISTTSLVGSNLIKTDQSNKSNTVLSKETPTTTERIQEATIRSALEEKNHLPSGQLATNISPTQARWTDMFKGEGIDNFAYLDLGKLQLFFFTIVLALLYAAAIGTRFDDHTRYYTGSAAQELTDIPDADAAEREAIEQRGQEEFQFPAFDTAMIAILGISHAGYLANKAAHQPPGA